jgi:hypothetical protein
MVARYGENIYLNFLLKVISSVPPANYNHSFWELPWIISLSWIRFTQMLWFLPCPEMLLNPTTRKAIRSQMLALVLRSRKFRSRVQTSTRKLTPLTSIYVMTKLLRNDHLLIGELLSRHSYLALSVIWAYPVLPPPLYNCPMCQCS